MDKMITDSVIVLVSSVILLTYLSTISSGIAGGDSGELVAEGCILGTAHPPGYPLFTMVCYLLTKVIRVGVSPAYRVNVFSALCTTLAASFIGLSVRDIWYQYIYRHTQQHRRDIYRSILLSCGISVCMCTFAFSPLIWTYAVTAEVFPMNTFFASLIVYLVIVFGHSRSIAIAILGAFTCGLALCNQHTIILYVAPLVLWMFFLLRYKLLSNYFLFIQLSMSFFLGLSPYAYLPITASYNPTIGSWGDLKSAYGFLHHFLRRDYGTFQLFSGNKKGTVTEGMIERTAAYIHDVHYHQDCLHVVLPFMCVGIIAIMLHSNASTATTTATVAVEKKASKSESKKNSNKKHTATTASTIIDETTPIVVTDSIVDSECIHTPKIIILVQAFYFFIFHSLSNLPLGDKLLFGVHQRFWMQPAVISNLLAGVGLAYFSLCAYSFFYRSSKFNGFKVVVTIVAALLSVFAMYKQYSEYHYMSDFSGENGLYFNKYAKALLEPLPQNSIVLINYDMQWTAIRYLQQCEGHRPDVIAINLSMMTYEWFEVKIPLYSKYYIKFPGNYLSYTGKKQVKTFTLTDFIDANIGTYPIFIGGKTSYPEAALEERYTLVPWGLLGRFIPHKPKGISTAKLVDKHLNATLYQHLLYDNWDAVTTVLPTLPDADKFPEEMWEWTIGRDYLDQIGDTASYFLEKAISIEQSDPNPLLQSIYWLETALHFESSHPEDVKTVGKVTMLLKNTGLAHLHLVRNTLIAAASPMPYPVIRDVLSSLDRLNWTTKKSIKEVSSERFKGRLIIHYLCIQSYYPLLIHTTTSRHTSHYTVRYALPRGSSRRISHLGTIPDTTRRTQRPSVRNYERYV